MLKTPYRDGTTHVVFEPKAIARDVRVEGIQPVVNDLLAANLIMRRGHGLYGVTDPFVQKIGREKKALEDKS